MTRQIVLGAVLALSAGGCLLPRPGLEHGRDEFARTETWRMRGNALSQPAGSGDWVALDAEAVRPRGDSVRYALLVDYRAQDEPLEIRRTESLVVLADTSRFVLSTTGVETDDDLRGSREVARYPVPPAVMRRIALAGEIRVRVVGRQWYVDRNVTSRGLWRFRRMMEAVEGIPVPPRPARHAPAAARPGAPQPVRPPASPTAAPPGSPPGTPPPAPVP